MKAKTKAGFVVALFGWFALTHGHYVSHYQHKVSEVLDSVGASAGVVTTRGAMTYGPVVREGYRMAAAYGWHGAQLTCLDMLWTHESGWQWNSQNPTSPAYGIPQADPGKKMAAAGADWRTNSATQIRWGLGYIRANYRTPCGAWTFEMSHYPNWY